jgi:hypothetical protein
MSQQLIPAWLCVIAAFFCCINTALGGAADKFLPLLTAQRLAVVGDVAAYGDAWVANLVSWMERNGTSAHVIDLRLPVRDGAGASGVEQAEQVDCMIRLVRPDVVLACAAGDWLPVVQDAAARADAKLIELPTVDGGTLPQRIAPADDVAAFLPEVTARLELLRTAYLSAAGLAVAGMPQGLPLADAEAKAAEITASIRLRRLELMGRLDKNGVWQMPIEWPRPPLVDPGSAAADPAPIPSDAIVLFGGTNLDEWTGADNWPIADGIATVKEGSIKTKRAFGDCQVHVEFRMPRPAAGKGQWRGNSGVFFMDLYEIQLLDSFPDGTDATLTTPVGQCGALYKLQPPAVNACRGPGEWQSFDILFTRPRFRPDGSLAAHGRVSVLHNGVAIHIDTVIKGTKPWHGPPMAVAHADALPITIQDHGSPVQFRSIWVRPFEPVQPQVTTPE